MNSFGHALAMQMERASDAQQLLVNEDVLQESHDFVVQFPMTTEFVLQRRIGKLFVEAIRNREAWIQSLDYEVLKKINDVTKSCVAETKLERQAGYINEKLKDE